jgi:hypothetical protein
LNQAIPHQVVEEFDIDSFLDALDEEELKRTQDIS